MAHILFAWVGNTDLNAAGGDVTAGLGPIGQAVAVRNYSQITILSNYAKDKSEAYLKWVHGRTSGSLCELYTVALTSPTDFTEIYEASVKSVSEAIKRCESPVNLTFHTSPGTPAMAAVWIILAKTRFPAELIESSRQAGVRTVSVPFEMSAEFIPDLLRRPDAELERLSAGLPNEAPEFTDVVHRSAVMKKLIAMARRVAPRRVPVLIEGESGTGKELLARAIHNASPRRERAFIPVNCGAIPAELVESELFGHEKGAFTGATQRRAGHFEAASGGSIFLDEVGELPLTVQVKLLRVLQESEVTRIGASKPQKIDVRVITATNRKLAGEVAAGRFREDLYYRLAVVVLQVPSLRERQGDVGLITGALLEKLNTESASELGLEPKVLSPAARNLLLQHHWPGNVRELLNTLVRSAIWSSGHTIKAEDVREALLTSAPQTSPSHLSQSLGDGFNIQEVISKVARHYLKLAIEQSHGNKTEAARLVGLSNYQTFTNWMHKYKVDGR